MSMFVDRLMEALAPAHRISQPGDELVVDTPRLRALFMSEMRKHEQAESLLGAERARGGTAALCAWVKDGWLDDYLHGIADSLIEMGVVREQGLLDHFLHAAVLGRLGIHNYLSSTDQMLLDLAGRPATPGCEELDVGLLARRYARQLDLLSMRSGSPHCTDLGLAVRRLPPELVLPFLLTLEGLSSYGSADPWRAPQHVYHLLYERGQITLPRGEVDRLQADPEGLWRFLRLRRWVRMGICDAVATPSDDAPATPEYAVRLSATGRRALHEALRTPPSEVAQLCEQLYRRSRQQALSSLLPRQAVLRDTGTVLPMRPAVPPPAPVAPRHATPPPRPPGDRFTWNDRLATLDEVVGPARLDPELLGQQDGNLPFSLEALCRETLREMQHSPRFLHVKLALSVQPGIPHEQLLLGHGRRSVHLLLLELLAATAAAVTGQPLPRVLIELSATEAELTLWLHDNGPGIPVSQRPLVFAEASAQGQPQPRYLLGAVRRVVEEQFHGRIEIAAPRLGGASFRLTFPRREQQQAA